MAYAAVSAVPRRRHGRILDAVSGLLPPRGFFLIGGRREFRVTLIHLFFAFHHLLYFLQIGELTQLVRLVGAYRQLREFPIDDRPIFVFPDVVAFENLARKLADDGFASRHTLMVALRISFGHLGLPVREIGAEFAVHNGRTTAHAAHVASHRRPLRTRRRR